MDNLKTLRHGNRFPYDASDEWWESDREPPKPDDWAHAAARGVLADLTDRRGIKDGFKRIHEDTRRDITLELAGIIRQAKNMDGGDYTSE
jgi:hypothetical protein